MLIVRANGRPRPYGFQLNDREGLYNGPLYLLRPSFDLPLGDAGSGAVDTSLLRGSGSATFTRAGATATTISSSGLVLKAIGANVARSYYDPTTLTYMGYVSEGARTNLSPFSEDFSNAAWVKNDTTVTADNTTSPDGTVNADLLTEGVAGTAQVTQTYTGTANATQTISRWVKRGNHDWLFLWLSETAASANRVVGWFNLNTGTVGTQSNFGTATGAVGTIKAYPNGWYRLTLSGAINNAATGFTTLTASASANGVTTRVNNATRYEWGSQFENNAALASTYIPTTAASVTRNADNLIYPFTGNGNITQGTAYAELSAFWSTAGALSTALHFGTNFILGVANAQPATEIRVNDGTTSLAKTGLASMNTGVRKRASSWGGAGMFVAGDGASPASSAFDGTQGDGTTLSVGDAGSWFGTIKNVRIGTPQLTSERMRMLTAG